MEALHMAIITMGELARRRNMKFLFECQVEIDQKIIGKVVHLITDKYERVSGLEVEPPEKGNPIIIKYEWVTGIDEERKVVITKTPAKKTN